MWDDKKILTGDFTYEYLDDGTFVETKRDLHDSSLPLERKQYKLQANGPLMVRQWYYSNPERTKKRSVLMHSDYYEYAPGVKEGRVKVRWLYDDQGEETEVVVFQYDPKAAPDSRPVSFKSYDVDGNLIRSYTAERTLAEALDLRAIYRANGESEEAIERHLARANAPGLIPVAIIDSGFDVFNPFLAEKMWRKPASPVPVESKDKNKWNDFVMGWDWERQQAIPLERLEVPRDSRPPLSHGSNTGYLAVDGLDYAAIVGFAIRTISSGSPDSSPSIRFASPT